MYLKISSHYLISKKNWHHNVVLTCISLITGKIKHFFHSSLDNRIFLNVLCLYFQSLCSTERLETLSWYYCHPSVSWTQQAFSGSKASAQISKTLRIT